MSASGAERNGGSGAAPGGSSKSGVMEVKPGRVPVRGRGLETASGCPRDYLDNRYVYVVISPRARGLSVGVNLNPDKRCNFDCVYCEVNRSVPPLHEELDVNLMSVELQETLAFVQSGRIRELPWYLSLPEELLELRHVALSGDGEPTLCPHFAEAVQGVVHIRALGGHSFFKIVLITNATGLHLPQVQHGLEHFTKADEIWVKLDAGTQTYMDLVNRPKGVSLSEVMSNILLLGRKRPIVIQSLFPQIHGQDPALEEIGEFGRRLRELRKGGAQISQVQIYSATRPTSHSECSHLSLKSLSRIAQAVRNASGLKVEVF